MAPDTKPRSGDKDNNFYANLERLRKQGRVVFTTCPYGKYIFREHEPSGLRAVDVLLILLHNHYGFFD